MNKLSTYISNAYNELLHKVTWPSWKELQETTGIVLLAIILITLVIFAMDVAFRFIFSILY